MAHYDIFYVAGQSNAVGWAGTTPLNTPNVGDAFYFKQGDTSITGWTDKIISASPYTVTPPGVSAWSSLAKKWTEITGNKTLWVTFGYGGAGIDEWGTGASLYTPIPTIHSELKNLLDTNGDTYSFISFLWIQGETDADTTLDNAGIIYKPKLESLISRLRIDLSLPNILFSISAIGYRYSIPSYNIGYDAVRQAQYEVALESGKNLICFEDAKNFDTEGMMDSDQIHYNAIGYDAIGTNSAIKINEFLNSTPKTLRLKRGSTSSNDAYTGLSSEITLDIDDDYRPRVHDGVKMGGKKLAFKSDVGEYAPITLVDSATVNWDYSLSSNAEVLLEDNRALSISNLKEGCFGLLAVTQDAVGGRSLLLPSNSKVIAGGGGIIELTSTPDAIDLLSFYYDGSTLFWTLGKNYT